jgi:DNA-binding transcriptional ArsR family regulator
MAESRHYGAVARQVDLDEVERIVQAIAGYPDGATVEQIGKIIDASHRTLQRRLSELVANGRARAVGRGKQRRYQLGARDGARADELLVSRSGQQVRSLVRRPLIQRTPVGYVASLLDEYRPNDDFYLDDKLRSRLHDLGRVPGSQRPAGTYARQVLSRLLVDLSWASSRLEGNTYTRLDTQNLIELGRRAPGKDQREAQMILNRAAGTTSRLRSEAGAAGIPSDAEGRARRTGWHPSDRQVTREAVGPLRN